MAPSYLGVVLHVRYWRGKVHRWSTAYPFTGSLSSALTPTDAQHLLTLDDAMCFGAAAADGGTYACKLYDVSAKGSPVASFTRFDWQTPGSWVAYGGSAWNLTGVQFSPVAESALVVEWPVGFSKTGKPVTLKKWYHAVVSNGGPGNTADLGAGVITSLTQGATALTGALASKGLVMGTGPSRLAGTPKVLPYYGAHQMQKGRRRKPLVKADGVYTGPTVRVPSGSLIAN